MVFGNAEDEHAGSLGHGFELQHAGHHGVIRKVSLEEVFVKGEVFDRGAGFFGEVDDAVNQEEGVAMGEDSEKVGGVKNRLALGDDDGGDEGHHLSILLFQGERPFLH